MGELFPKTLVETAERTYWFTFLSDHRAYAEGAGFSFDESSDHEAFVDMAYAFLNDPDEDRPTSLRAALGAIAHLADDDGYRRIVSGLRAIKSALPWAMTPLEAALWTYEHAHPVFQEALRLQHSDKKDHFYEYLPQARRALVGARTADVRALLEQRMSVHHRDHGHSGCVDLDVRVLGHETRLLWSRGKAPRQHGIITLKEQRSRTRYIPERYDLAVIDHATGRLALSIEGDDHRAFARELLGEVLFNDRAHFIECSDIYTGTPILERGAAALSVHGLPGLRSVKLRKLRLELPGRGRHIFEDPQDIFDWRGEDAEDFRRVTCRSGVQVTELKLALVYGPSVDARVRTIEIFPPDRIRFDRAVDEPVVRELLVARCFANYGFTPLALAAAE